MKLYEFAAIDGPEQTSAPEMHQRIIAMATELKQATWCRADHRTMGTRQRDSPWQAPQGKHSGGLLVSRLRMMWSVGETPQPAATGAHSMAGMGHCREGAPSNSNLLAALHSGLEQAHEVRGP
jgi:hypothetical protein